MPNNPMARDGDGKRVGGTGAGDGPHGFGRADPLSDHRVSYRLTDGDLLQRLPHALLKGRAPDIKRQVEADMRRFDKANDLCDQLLVVFVTSHQTSPRKAVLQIADQNLWVVIDQDGGNPFLTGRNQNGAKRALA